MAITRAEIEAVLIARCGKRLALVGMDGTTADGSNQDLTDPLVTAFMELGCQPVNTSTLADADLVLLDAACIPELLDRAERRVLVTVYNQIELVNLAVGPMREDLGQIAERIEKAILRLDKKITAAYDADQDNQLAGGWIHLDFTEKDTW